MKAGLVLPRFYPGDAIQGERVDEHIKLLAEQINGGLTAQSLSPSLKIPVAFFAEQRSPFLLNGFANGVAQGSQIVLGVLNSIARPIGVSWNLVVSQSTTIRTITVSTNGTARLVVANIQAKQFLNTKNQLIITGFSVVDEFNDAFSAGDYVTVTWTSTGAETMQGNASVSLATIHTT